MMKRSPDDTPLVVEVETVSEEKMRPQRRKKAALLKKAIWIHTWVLLSWALTSQQVQMTTAVATPENTWTSGAEIEVSQKVEMKPETWEETEKDEEDDDVIVIATVDGTLAGLSRKTGKTLWKQPGVGNFSEDRIRQDLKSREEHMRPQSSKEKAKHRSSRTRLLSPLLSTTTTTTSDDHKTAAVPSVDGRVYLTAGRESSGAPDAEETESTQVSELVSRAPFVDGRGSFYVGTRHATAAALDRDTGEILRVVSGESVAPNECGDIGKRKIVWLGRVDNSVSMYDTRTGASDVQFSTSQVMSVQDMLAGTGHVAERRPSWDATLEHAPHLDSGDDEDAFRNVPKPSLVVATPNGNVAFRNPETGEIEWVAEESFETPVAFAVQSSTGESLGVDIVPDTPIPSSSSDYVSRELERQMRSLINQSEEEEPLVGSLPSGQLFAMPLGNRKRFNPYQTLGFPHHHSIASGVLNKQSGKELTRQSSGLQTITGKHAQDVTSQRQSEKVALKKKPCIPSNPAFPGCLLGSAFKQGGGTNAHYQQSLSRPLELGGEMNDQAVTIHYHPEIGYMANEEQVHSLLHRNKTSRSFFRIMASWLPPTMALIFVLSFEFGRRHKLRKEAQAQGTDQNGKVEGGGMLSSADVNAGRNVGVIQVSDEILGYGGHGTMVYKGTLDGRKVAVKRMLKTYHASADREISLLIESDGHPNVVRYFLKEVRGDFVYLALELCDLSLHDLIGLMNSRGPLELGSGSISPAVKSTMLQIASGVRHLHSLRIVHRDLKPANILAQSKDSKLTRSTSSEAEDCSVLAKFDRGEYVAKISDMGLGKQLAGQSSFGFSTLGNASLANMPSDGSALAGAGPGSVGWQAPEVMAIRWHAEASSSNRSESSVGQESLAEASPVEVAMSSRTSRSVDIFSLGCIFYSTLIPGSHPFGEWYEREANIMRNKPRTEALKEISEDAYDLIMAMIDRDAKARPTAEQVCHHPFFWTPQQRLNFLCDVSDRLECADTEVSASESSRLALVGNSLAIEKNAAQVVGMAWDKELDPDLVTNVSRFRTYDPSSVRDCLRLIRNKHHHYDELSAEIKERVGTNPDGLQQYFESRFPGLLMHCYSILREQITTDDPLAIKYKIAPCRLKQTLDKENQTSRVSEPSAQETADETVSVAPISTETPLTSSTSSPDRNENAECVDIAPLLDESDANEHSSASSLESSTYVKVSGPPFESEQSPCVEDVTEEAARGPVAQPSYIQEPPASCEDVVVWEGSTAAKSLGCRGWFRSDDEWIRKTDLSLRKRNSILVRCADDPKFRTRLCNHWDVSQGTFCPMRRKSKCVFAHGPVELRVKEGKRNRWGKLVDKNGDNANPQHSGGEDTYGAARSIESVRKEEGKWNTNKPGKGNKGKPPNGKKRGS